MAFPAKTHEPSRDQSFERHFRLPRVILTLPFMPKSEAFSRVLVLLPAVLYFRTVDDRSKASECRNPPRSAAETTANLHSGSTVNRIQPGPHFLDAQKGKTPRREERSRLVCAGVELVQVRTTKSASWTEKILTNISPSRYISRIQTNGLYASPRLSAEYVGQSGILFRADALQLLANIRTNSVDLAFVDPPFNLGKDYENPDFGDEMGGEFYKGWCRTWLLELVRVLKPGGSLFIYHLPKWLIEFGNWLNTIHHVEYKAWIALKMKSGFPVKGRIHPAHYGLLHYAKTGARVTFNVVRTKSPVCRHCGKLIRDYGGYKDKYKKYELNGAMWVQISDFWEDTRPARQEKARAKFVNELPVQIPERAILLASRPGDVVLDCFAG